MDARNYNSIETSQENLFAPRRGQEFTEYQRREQFGDVSARADEMIAQSRVANPQNRAHALQVLCPGREQDMQQSQGGVGLNAREALLPRGSTYGNVEIPYAPSIDRSYGQQTFVPSTEKVYGQQTLMPSTERIYGQQAIMPSNLVQNTLVSPPVSMPDTLESTTQQQSSRLFVGGPQFDASCLQGASVHDFELSPSVKTMRFASKELSDKFDMAPMLDVDFDGTLVQEPTQADAHKRTKIAAWIYTGVTAVVAGLIVLTGALVGAINKNIASKHSVQTSVAVVSLI